MNYRFGSLQIIDLGKSEIIDQGQTYSKRKSSGKRYLFSVSGLPGLAANLAYIRWDNGDREVRGLPGSEPARNLSRLSKGGRISINTHGVDYEWMELRIMRVTSKDPNIWGNRYKTDAQEIQKANRFDVAEELFRLGALEIGTRKEVTGERNKNRADLCVLFPRGNKVIPIAAFASVRVLPLYYEWE